MNQSSCQELKEGSQKAFSNQASGSEREEEEKFYMTH
jgi:hypothetical protein